jgi:hypothetical protein
MQIVINLPDDQILSDVKGIIEDHGLKVKKHSTNKMLLDAVRITLEDVLNDEYGEMLYDMIDNGCEQFESLLEEGEEED